MGRQTLTQQENHHVFFKCFDKSEPLHQPQVGSSRSDLLQLRSGCLLCLNSDVHHQMCCDSSRFSSEDAVPVVFEGSSKAHEHKSFHGNICEQLKCQSKISQTFLQHWSDLRHGGMRLLRHVRSCTPHVNTNVTRPWHELRGQEVRLRNGLK